MNDDKQTTESFSAQEGSLELNDEALEGVTGAGLVSFFKGLFRRSSSNVPAESKPEGEGAATYPRAAEQNKMLKQAGIEERYRPAADGFFYLKK